MDLEKIYNYLIVESADPLTRGWPLIDSPFPIAIITAVYIYFVLYAGPRYMKNRPPIELKTFILLYNLFQILANVWLVKQHISAGWLINDEYSLNVKCTSRNKDPTTPNGFSLITTGWWLLIVKLIDYIETCVFVLRKKQNQVSALHVYHHVTIVFVIWYNLKYIVHPVTTIVSLVNCSVHVIMYTYYFAAACGTEVQQILSPFKSYITKIQMIQIVWLLFVMVKTIPECEYFIKTSHVIMFYISFFMGISFLYLFYDFYKKTYKQHKQKAK